jgi:NAD(P)-dependent dehydrogenase (short-subunit alcohol dehydrogenase family)
VRDYGSQLTARPRKLIITGASSGVGEAVARAFAELGCDLALVARRGDRLRALGAELDHVIPIVADLSSAGDAARAMVEAEKHLGSVDALVLCHGTNVPRRRLDLLTVQDWDTIVAANLSSAFYCLHAVLPGMRARGGRIIAISSIAALRPTPLGGAAYAASKAGLNALCSVLNQEERSSGILATVIAPGNIDTEIMDKRPEPPSPDARTRMLRPEDIARMVVDVLSYPDRVWTEEIIVHPSSWD